MWINETLTICERGKGDDTQVMESVSAHDRGLGLLARRQACKTLKHAPRAVLYGGRYLTE